MNPRRLTRLAAPALLATLLLACADEDARGGSDDDDNNANNQGNNDADAGGNNADDTGANNANNSDPDAGNNANNQANNQDNNANNQANNQTNNNNQANNANNQGNNANNNVVTSGCGQAPGANDRAWTLQHDGLTRTFYVHLPAGYDPARPAPVVLSYHGRGITAQQHLLYTGMNAVADANGFIAVHPEGTGSFEQTWNAELCCGSAASNDVDDVGFTAAMLDALERDLCVDTRRVYATGLSNGGFFAHRLGCDLADRVTAIAPVSGTQGLLDCNPARPVPVLHFHGTDDNIVPYNGFAGFVSVDSTIEGWNDQNGCPDQPTITFMQDDVTCEEWGPCEAGSAVQLCTIDDGGHTWPGAPDLGGFLGRTTQTINASEAMWDFFARFALP